MGCIKKYKIDFIVVPKREEQNWGRKKRQITFKNFPNLVTNITLVTWELQQNPSERNPKKTTLRQIVVRMLKNQNNEKKITKTARGKQSIT